MCGEIKPQSRNFACEAKLAEVHVLAITILSDIGIDEFANTNLNTTTNAQIVIQIQI